MTVNISIEARMTSSRLPGKVLKPINNKPNLEIMIQRVKKAKLVDNIIVATTTNKTDDIIVQWCIENNIDYFRGSENNVFDRVLKTHQHFNSDIIVELTGDCPLLDPMLIDEAISIYLNNSYDYILNDLETTYPVGMGVQVYSLATLLSVSTDRELTYEDKEHVSPYLYTSGKYNIYNIKAPQELTMPELSVTLDTQEDFELIQTICSSFDNFDFSLKEIIAYAKNNLEILNINKDIQRKGLS